MPFSLIAASLIAFTMNGRSMQEGAPSGPELSGDTVSKVRKLQAKMTIQFCSSSAHVDSTGRSGFGAATGILPCQEEIFQQSLKGLSQQERQEAITKAVAAIETKRKKKVALAMHDDAKQIYDVICGNGKTNEICTNDELKAYLNSPLDLQAYKGRGYADSF